jgi:hypothetical protein
MRVKHTLVMAGLDPAIHALLACGAKDVDARVKPGHDDGESGVGRRAYGSGAQD